MLNKLQRTAKVSFCFFSVVFLSAYLSSFIFQPPSQKLFSGKSRIFEAFENGVNLRYLSKLSTDEIGQMILVKVPTPIKKYVENYLEIVLNEASAQKLDPFWILSLIWTESHFDPDAISPVGARGLMQLMPATYKGLLQEHTGSLDDLHLIDQPEQNIRFALKYLKKLLVIFNHNYYFATLAYNIGPTRLSTILKWSNEPVLRDHYYFKVRAKYIILSDSYKRFVHSERTYYKQTYVYSQKGQLHKKRFFDLRLGSILLDHHALKMI